MCEDVQLADFGFKDLYHVLPLEYKALLHEFVKVYKLLNHCAETHHQVAFVLPDSQDAFLLFVNLLCFLGTFER